MTSSDSESSDASPSAAKTANLARSQFLNAQKSERAELEKKVKSLKGAYKDAAMLQLEALQEKQTKDLEEFDKGHHIHHDAHAVKDHKQAKEDMSSKDKVSKEKVPKVTTTSPKAHKLSREMVKELATLNVEKAKNLSKKELADVASALGIGKGGSKEDLVSKLVIFVSEGGVDKYKQMLAEMSESESESESEDDEAKNAPSTADERARQGKREKIVQQALVQLMEADEDLTRFGVGLDEIASELENIGISNFKPESLGYKDLHDFARHQPREMLRYDRSGQRLFLPNVTIQRRPGSGGVKARNAAPSASSRMREREKGANQAAGSAKKMGHDDDE